MQVINAILGSKLNIDAELTEAQMELLCGGEEYPASEEIPPGSCEEIPDSYAVEEVE